MKSRDFCSLENRHFTFYIAKNFRDKVKGVFFEFVIFRTFSIIVLLVTELEPPQGLEL